MAPRPTSEWIGKRPESAAPPKVRQRVRDRETHKRRRAHQPLTLDMIFERSIPEPNSGCWLWMAAIDHRHGYGAIKNGKRVCRAHRVAFELATRQRVPRSLDVCHRCDVRSCVNPDHLFIGSRAENMLDCIQKGRFKVVPVLMGEDSPNSKLTAAQVLSIRADPRSQRALARFYGVDKGTIACIIKRTTWRHI